MAPWIARRIRRFLTMAALTFGALVGCGGRPPPEAPPWRSGRLAFVPPPPGILRERAAVRPFLAEDGLGDRAADALTTILWMTDRFEVVERTQIAEDVAYVWYGKVKSLSLRPHRGDSPSRGDRPDRASRVTVECVVELRMCETRTGITVAGGTGTLQDVATIGELGVEILGLAAGEPEELQVGVDDRSKIVRLTLYPTLQRMLPEIDRHLVRKAREAGRTPPAGPRAPPVFCPMCGAKQEPGAAFCGSCGARSPG